MYSTENIIKKGRNSCNYCVIIFNKKNRYFEFNYFIKTGINKNIIQFKIDKAVKS